MTPLHLYYSALLATAGFACLVVAMVVWQMRRGAAGAFPLTAALCALAWWDLTHGLHWADAPTPLPYFWLDISVIAIVCVPACYLAFALQMTQRGHWLTMPVLIALAIEPVVAVALLWTDPWHNLFFAGKHIGVILEAGPMFWTNLLYGYLLMLATCLLLVRQFWRSTGLYRKQLGMALIGAGFPWINSILFVTGVNPLPNVDTTPVSFSISALAFAYAVLRYQMLDIVPIARDMVIEDMRDGVIVVDAKNRLVDLNRVAQQVMSPTSHTQVGVSVEKALAAWPELVEKFDDMREQRTEITTGGPSPRHLDLHISPLFDHRQQLLGRILVWRDITELKRLQTELRELATTDALTKAINRRHFLELAENERHRSNRLQHCCALVLMDIDHFKRINDTYGHPAGDQALMAFVRICRTSIRMIDVLARFGGEEFVLLLPESNDAQAAAVAERLRVMTAQTSIDLGPCAISLTISLGISMLLGESDTLEQMIARADQALYTAKHAGRNRVVLWQPHMAEAGAGG